MKRSVCCQQPLKGGLGVPWLLMRKHALRLRHLRLYLDGERVWSPHAKALFPRLESLANIGSWIYRRPRQGLWQAECRKAIRLISRVGNVGSMRSTLEFYSGMIVGKAEDVLGESLGADEGQLADLFRRTFGPKYLNNYQKSLAWQCYRSALPVRDKLSRHGGRVSPICPRCEQDRETVLHAFVECPKLADLITYVERVLSSIGRVQLSAESIIKIVPPPSFRGERLACFFCTVAILKEVVWLTRRSLSREDFRSLAGG